MDLTFVDRSLARRLQGLIPATAWDEASARLERMGRLAAGDFDRLAQLADRNPPTLVSWDRNGDRVDEVCYHESYRELRRRFYAEGVIARAYREPKDARDPHALTFGLGMLFGMAEAGLYCPICMTDGAARVLERFAPPALAKRFIPRLGAAEAPLEGAMWLTERQGGSDVGANETRARRPEAPTAGAPEGLAERWLLSGEKFFCSNLGAEVALVLARPEGAPGGTAGLGLFLVPLTLEDGKRNAGLRFRRLKDKLGTRSMATGEVELVDAIGYLVSGSGQGFKAMADMLNMSRLYNAVAACAVLRRAWREAATYAAERTAFGRRLDEHPLQQEVIAGIAVDAEAATALTFEAVRRLDRLDGGSADPADRILHRSLTTLVKLWTGKMCVAGASEAVEALGGNGYVEERATSRLFRDAQVLPIWEGTTNILSLDFVFRLGKEGAHEALARFGEGLVAEVAHESLAGARDEVRRRLAAAKAAAMAALAAGPEEGARSARSVAEGFGRALAGAMLVAEGERDLRAGDARGALVANRYVTGKPLLDARKYAAIVRCEVLPA